MKNTSLFPFFLLSYSGASNLGKIYAQLFWGNYDVNVSFGSPG